MSEECIDLTTVEDASDDRSTGNHGDVIDMTEDDEVAEVEHKLEEMSFQETPSKSQVARSSSHIFHITICSKIQKSLQGTLPQDHESIRLLK